MDENEHDNRPGLDCLNCGKGHLEIRFDIGNAIEIEIAKRTIEDMLRRGYALFLPGQDGKMVRVNQFDSTAGVYIVGAGATVMSVDDEPLPPITEDPVTTERTAPAIGKVRKGNKPVKIPMHKVRATVVGRSAGG